MKVKELKPKKTFKEMFSQNEVFLGTLTKEYKLNSKAALEASKRFKKDSKEQVMLQSISHIYEGLSLTNKIVHNNSNTIYAIRDILANYSKVFNEIDDRIELIVMSLSDKELKEIKSQLAEQKPIIDDIKNNIKKKQEELEKADEVYEQALKQSKETLKHSGHIYG